MSQTASEESDSSVGSRQHKQPHNEKLFLKPKKDKKEKKPKKPNPWVRYAGEDAAINGLK